MAKMFYTMDEAKAALAKSEEEIKQFAREGRLREFRDGPRLMFKSDQVENLKNELAGGGSGGGADIGVSDTGAPIGLADSNRSGTGASITFADPGISGSGLGSGLGAAQMLSGSGLSNMQMKDDTALAADLGLSGTVGGMPSPRAPSIGTGLSGSVSGSKVGVNVFGEDTGAADPMAQTAISPGIRGGGGGGDQISLDAIGSGSGLLDLTRESDDTSLGADLLDEIAPGTGKRTTGGSLAGESGTLSGTTGGLSALEPPRGGPVRAAMPVREVEAPDSLAPAFGGAALAGSIALAFAAFAVIAASLGTAPNSVKGLADQSFLVITAIGLGLAVVFFVGGLLIGKAFART
ncbi:MAG TPA: hypothetical protein VK324_08935 [Tepidisphaeraceae bacterium]|nr:hypothetical protein [Tepidisphaeraceae bacterium]